MVYVVASIQVVSGKRDQFIAIFNALVPTVLQEQGCIEYFPAIDVEAGLDTQLTDENCVTILEKWQSLESLHAHLHAPHMDEFRKNVAEIVVSLTMKILGPT